MPDFGFGAGTDRQVADEVRLDGRRHHGRPRSTAPSTSDWDINDNLGFEAILSDWEQFQRPGHRLRRHGVPDHDGRHLRRSRENQTVELHLTGTAWNDRISWLAGYYSLEEDLTQRFYRWGMWEFVNTAAITPDEQPRDGLPVLAAERHPAHEYVRQTAFLLDI